MFFCNISHLAGLLLNVIKYLNCAKKSLYFLTTIGGGMNQILGGLNYWRAKRAEKFFSNNDIHDGRG